jgi:hypothetical protein
MIRRLAVFSVVLVVSACTVSIRSPKLAFSKVEKAEHSNEEVTTAHNTSVFRWPGLTLSIAGTYLPGRTGHTPSTEPEFRFERKEGSSFALNISATGQCRASPAATRLLTSALAKLWDYSGGLSSQGRVDIQIVGADVRVVRYNLSLHTGRAYRLKYWTPCVESDPDAALFFGATIALHESTHGSLDMVDGESHDAFERERVAVGAEACLYLAVRSLDETFTQQHKALLGRFDLLQASQLGTNHVELTSLCKAWKASMDAANTRHLTSIRKDQSR